MDPTLSHDLIEESSPPAERDLEKQTTRSPNTSTPTPTTTKCHPTSKHDRGWRRIVRNFTPSWFSVNMGTGIVSILLHNLPYNGRWLQYISYILFALNVFLFAVFLTISVLRYTLYPRIWTAMIRHPAQSLFLGTFPMGLATIVNMVAFVCVPAWGGDTWKLAWALWWIDVVISVSVCCGLPFMIMAAHEAKLESMTAAWLLPIVSTIVASASGGVVATVIPSPREAQITLFTSYVLLGTGLPLAMIVLALYFLRLTTKSLPPREVVVSTFLPLGPLGQGAYSIMQLGKVAKSLFKVTGALPTTSVYAGDVLYIFGFLFGILLFGFGLVWLFFALATIRRAGRFPFNVGWWGFVFPLGVYAVATTTLGDEIPSAFFRILGTIFSVAVTLLWMVVSIGTLQRVWSGQMFYAPCLKDLPGKEPCRETKQP